MGSPLRGEWRVRAQVSDDAFMEDLAGQIHVGDRCEVEVGARRGASLQPLPCHCTCGLVSTLEYEGTEPVRTAPPYAALDAAPAGVCGARPRLCGYCGIPPWVLGVPAVGAHQHGTWGYPEGRRMPIGASETRGPVLHMRAG